MRMATAVALLVLAGCQPPGDEGGDAFDDSENDATLTPGLGKADAIAGYRSGCQGTLLSHPRYALKGDVVTPGGVLTSGFVVIEDEQIVEVRRADEEPVGIPVVDTAGAIFPGLLDAHNHTEYDALPLWQAGRRFGDRDQWPRTTDYRNAIKAPHKAVSTAGLTCTALKYGELRALVGGTTAMQGTPYSPCVRPLVRNLEQTNFCQDRVRTNVLPAVSYLKGDPSFATQVANDRAAGKLDAFVIHLAEGIDEHAHEEWQILKSANLLQPELVLIHGTALGAAEFAEMAQVGAKLVWSPLSNLLLYGQTTDIPAAVQAGVKVSLGPDWAPSGSANVLAELKVADRVNRQLWNGVLTDEQLVDMVTTNPAAAFGLSSHLGKIEPGYAADLLVIHGRPDSTPYRALIESQPGDVSLVVIAGEALFGEPALMTELGKGSDMEMVDACGTPKALDATVVAKDVPGGADSYESVRGRLAEVLPNLNPVFQCGDDAANAAFAGAASAAP